MVTIVVDETLKETRSKSRTNTIRISCFHNSQEAKIESWIGIEHGLDMIEGIPQLELIETNLRQEQESEI